LELTVTGIAAVATMAATIAVVHTAAGIDHYLPFILLGRAERWSLKRILFWTGCCGLAHVLSSLAIAAIAALLGWAAGSMTSLQQIRGEVLAFVLIGFGLLYGGWGLVKGTRDHTHFHAHADGTLHAHPHLHDRAEDDHDDLHHRTGHRRTLWGLMVIFVLGPCEPLIPLLLAPSVKHDAIGMIVVVGVFSLATIGSMIALVALGCVGLRFARLGRLERWSHALAGFAVALSGILVHFLGL
jgi:hypothetical protein